MASSLKAKGNDAYQKRNFDVAVGFYTDAIKVSPKPEPVFYSNRAACMFGFHYVMAWNANAV